MGLTSLHSLISRCLQWKVGLWPLAHYRLGRRVLPLSTPTLRNTPAPSTAEGKAGRFFHGTKLPLCHGGQKENWAGKAPRGGRGFLRLFGRGNDDVWYGQAARGAASPVSDATPGKPITTAAAARCQAHQPGELTSKAGMWFCFMGIVLASPPSIKDSEVTLRGGAAPPTPGKRRCRTPMGCGWGRRLRGNETKAGKYKKTGG
jgi:hypothetical protein